MSTMEEPQWNWQNLDIMLLALRGERDVREAFDILSAHAFSRHGFEVSRLRQVMERHGVEKPIWVTELNHLEWEGYDDAARGIDAVFAELAAEGVERTFWFQSWTSNWGPGIFLSRSREADPTFFQPSPFYAIYQARALQVPPPASPQVTWPPERARVSHRPALHWTVPESELPIAGYRLQLERDTYWGLVVFHSPEVNA